MFLFEKEEKKKKKNLSWLSTAKFFNCISFLSFLFYFLFPFLFFFSNLILFFIFFTLNLWRSYDIYTNEKKGENEEEEKTS